MSDGLEAHRRVRHLANVQEKRVTVNALNSSEDAYGSQEKQKLSILYIYCTENSIYHSLYNLELLKVTSIHKYNLSHPLPTPFGNTDVTLSSQCPHQCVIDGPLPGGGGGQFLLQLCDGAALDVEQFLGAQQLHAGVVLQSTKKHASSFYHHHLI